MEIMKGLAVFLIIVFVLVAVIFYCVRAAILWNERLEKTKKVLDNGKHDKRK